MKTTFFSVFILLFATAGCAKGEPAQTSRATTPESAGTSSVTATQVIAAYSAHVYDSYRAALRDAQSLQKAVHRLIADPTEVSLKQARQAWLQARESYGPTEVFRFYEGPIDAPAQAQRPEGPEGRMNAWPLNEAYIDYVQGNPRAGIISDGLQPITGYALKSKNAHDDESDVTLGYHAIEFLLWGQDFNPDGPGTRPATDYQGDSPVTQRRREYLTVCTQILVDDLQGLVSDWAPDEQNYRALFVQQERDALGKILTGMATLTGFELASERIAVALDSGSQEDEQSCFSDNTHNDHRANLRGVRDVFIQSNLNTLIAQANPQLEQKLSVNIEHTLGQLQAVEPPIDRVLTSPADSPGRKQLETIVSLLQQQSELLVEAGRALGVDVIVAGE